MVVLVVGYKLPRDVSGEEMEGCKAKEEDGVVPVESEKDPLDLWVRYELTELFRL